MKQKSIIFLWRLCASIVQHTSAQPPETIIQKVIRKYKESPTLTGITVGSLVTLATLMVHHEVIANHVFPSAYLVPTMGITTGLTAINVQRYISLGMPATKTAIMATPTIVCDLILFLSLYYQAHVDSMQ